ncbi:MAG: hypothetical protein U0Y82_08960 [Thermoleophilia bacterium]
MSAGLVWVCVILGLGAVVVRRRTAAAAMVAAQSLCIGLAVSGLGSGGRAGDPLPGGGLILKAAAVAALLWWAIGRTRQPRPIGDDAGPAVNAALALALAAVLIWLVPVDAVGAPTPVRGGLAVLACGLVMAMMRRATLFTLMGLLVAENGVTIAALGGRHGLPGVVELGVAFDLTVLVAVAVAFQSRILGAFGTTDTTALRDLRD